MSREENAMEIRPASMEDLPAMLAVYDSARRYMRQNGNLVQWVNGYPQQELLEEDIRLGRSFVCTRDGAVHAAFCFFVGDEPSYREIDGAWPDDAPYGVIHRLGSDGALRGVARRCFDWCFAQGANLRADTHRDNRTMQALLEAAGFSYCGVVVIEDGTQRLAYQKSQLP